jgi:RNA polymerase sigma factor (sigma-70 family)
VRPDLNSVGGLLPEFSCIAANQESHADVGDDPWSATYWGTDGTFAGRRRVYGAYDMTVKSGDDPVGRAKAGDRSAFDELVGPLVDQGFRLAFGMLHDREGAEDAVQEATVRSWRKLGNLRPGTEMRPWFLAIVANQCRTVARGRWWSVIRLEGSGTAASGFEDRVVRGADLRAALRRLPVDQREVLVLRYYLDLPLEEVAAITGVPVGTVKSRINRALAAMRPQFEPVEALT